jgi:hypothetical protein
MSDQTDPGFDESFPALSLVSVKPPGWLVHVYASMADAGVVVTRLDIRQDPSAGTPLAGITATVLSNLSLPDIRAQIIERIKNDALRLSEALAEIDEDDPAYNLLARATERATREAEMTSHDQTRRIPLSRQREWAEQAKTVLTAAQRARDEKSDLARVLEDEWQMNPEGIKSRLRRLKERKYIRGRGKNLVTGRHLDEWNKHN